MRRAAHLRLEIKPIEREHHRSTMRADPRCQPHDLGLVISRTVDHDMAIPFGQCDEIALGVDHHLLHQLRALFEQAAQQVRFARSRIALHQQARGEQLLDIDTDRRAGPVGADDDGLFLGCAHAGALSW